MGKFVILLSCMLLVISCDDRCGDAVDQGYVNNNTDDDVKFIEFFSSGQIDTVVIRKGSLTHVPITQYYLYLEERFDSVIFEKDKKFITYRNMRYGDGLSTTNHYFNCKAIAHLV